MADNGKKATDEHNDRGDKQDTAASVPGATEAQTNDPSINLRGSGPPPDRAVAYQTSGLSGSAAAYPLPGTVGVVQCDDNDDRRGRTSENERPGKQDDESPKQQARHNQAREAHDSGDDQHLPRERGKLHGQARKAKKKLEHMGRKMPRWPTLLIVGVLSFVCGVGGAWGYTALFGPSQSADQGESSNKGGKSSDQGGTSDKSGGAKSGQAGSDQSSENKDLKENMEDLDDGITQLTARLDRLTEAIQESRLPIPEYYSGTSRIARMGPASDESPPILPNALPTQLKVLERKVDQMSELPARVSALEELVETMQKEIKMLAARRTEP